MHKSLFTAAFIVGALAITWVGINFIDASFLAIAMTLLIGAVYLCGAAELHRFRLATASLTTALAAIPEQLADLHGWLGGVDGALQNPVRLRIEGERVGLPGPVLTPYLVGLLVMLGMLGTFLGMVVTLKGAVFTLEKTTDLEAMRSALAVPVKGLGLAFGTSVAGVAASAMLGLMSALARRERLQAAHILDAKIATVLRGFSLTHQRQETFRALQLQSQALPQVVDKLQAMMLQMEAMGAQVNQRLLANQEAFHGNVKEVYTGLAQSVDASLQDSLGKSAQAAADSLKPVFEATLSGIAQETKTLHQRTADAVQQQLDGLAERFGSATAGVAATWQAALVTHQEASSGMLAGVERSLSAFNESFEQRSAALVTSVGAAYAQLQAGQAGNDVQRQEAWSRSLELMAATLTKELQQNGEHTLAQQREICSTVTSAVQDITAQAKAGAGASLAETTRLLGAAEELMRSRIAAEAQWITQHHERMDQLASLLRTELGALKDQEAARGAAAVDRLGELQGELAAHLTTLGTAMEAPITRLIETASEAPRAAAEVIGQLRAEISSSVARDNVVLEERSRIMETLSALLETINHASHEQRTVIDTLVASSAVKLDAAGAAFSHNIATEAGKLEAVGAHLTTSAVDVASLAESFGAAVNAFNEANEKLIANLERIEGVMDKSMSRSDEQLAYYVAQAREIIDLSMSSQKGVVDELRQLSGRAVAAEENK